MNRKERKERGLMGDDDVAAIPPTLNYTQDLIIKADNEGHSNDGHNRLIYTSFRSQMEEEVKEAPGRENTKVSCSQNHFYEQFKEEFQKKKKLMNKIDGKTISLSSE
jgi:hypothetical protein